ncbi:O-antigen ligase family protein [Bowmanella denitrificans]|uniref:O-antigen ligase family protein n=1 Tax=Bowmanella denitrificans TaxID=366582 RepID=UPI000C9C9286|nr:O-antigen ligase family protein [Bowmanella denitrificans]
MSTGTRNLALYRIAVFALFCMFFVVDASFRLRDFDDKSIDFQVVIKFLVLFFTIGIGAIALRYFRFYSRFLFVLPFFALMLISSIWSESLFFTLSIFFTFFSYFIFMVFFIDEYGLGKFSRIVTLSMFWFLVVSLLLYVFFPEMGRFSFWFNDVFAPSWRMSGLTTSANNFARVCGFFVLFLVGFNSIIKVQVGARFYNFCLILAAVCLLLSGSRTTIVVLLVSLSLYVFLQSNKQNKALWISSVFCFGLILALFSEELLQLVSRDGGDDITSFTGRTFIWDAVLYFIDKKPVLGYGFGSSIFLLPEYADALGFTAAHAHNMYLQVMLSGGYVTLSVFLFLMLFCLYKSLKLNIAFVTSSLVFILLIGFFESGAISLTANMLTLLLFFNFYLIATPGICSSFRGEK